MLSIKFEISQVLSKTLLMQEGGQGQLVSLEVSLLNLLASSLHESQQRSQCVCVCLVLIQTCVNIGCTPKLTQLQGTTNFFV